MIQRLRDDLMVQQQLPATHEWFRRWQHMVAVIMLNQTGRKPVKTVLPVFLISWPDPYAFLRADSKIIRDVIWSLGMVNVREKRLVQMTRDYLTWDGKDASGNAVPPGNYTFVVEGRVGGKTVALNTAMNERVSSVSVGSCFAKQSSAKSHCTSRRFSKRICSIAKY